MSTNIHTSNPLITTFFSLCFSLFCFLILSCTYSCEAAELGGGNTTPTPLTSLLSMDETEIKNRMKILFSFMDKDESSTLTREELHIWIEIVGKKVNEKQGLVELKVIDKDGDMKASFEELKSTHMDSDEDLDERAIEDLRKRFKAVDKNGDGLLDVSEIAILFNPGSDPQLLSIEIDYIIEAQDKDKDRRISLDEFLHHEQSEGLSDVEIEQMKAEFKTYDLNADGFISEEEIKSVVSAPGTADIGAAVEKLFANATDGVISEESWVNEYQNYIISHATDNGELLRFPEDYDLNLPFKNVKKRDDKIEEPNDGYFDSDLSHDEL